MALRKINAVNPVVWYFLYFASNRLSIVENFTASFSEETPQLYDYNSPFGTVLFYFEKNKKALFHNGTFVIPNFNKNLRDLYLLASFKTIEIAIYAVSTENFNCLKGYSGSLIFENGIFSFINSQSYIMEASLVSSVELRNIVIHQSILDEYQKEKLPYFHFQQQPKHLE